jgi:hypothetical protein
LFITSTYRALVGFFAVRDPAAGRLANKASRGSTLAVGRGNVEGGREGGNEDPADEVCCTVCGTGGVDCKAGGSCEAVGNGVPVGIGVVRVLVGGMAEARGARLVIGRAGVEGALATVRLGGGGGGGVAFTGTSPD